MFLKSKHSTDLTDADLILQYKKKNDPDVLGHLYARYVTLVYGLCLNYFADREKAKDLAMQIFEQLAVDLHRYEIRNFKNWLYVFSKNHCLMEIRKQNSLKRREQIWLDEHRDFMEFHQENHPIDKDADSGLNEALNDCISRLKAEQKQCVYLFYFENKSYREITVLIGLDEKKVKSLLQNGKRNLKICLERKHAD